MVAAVLVAAAMHAAWNAIAHAIDDRLVGFALISVAYLVVGATIVAVTGLPPADAWPFIAVSAVTHVAYNLFLMASYQLGDFSQTYPLARGISPVVVAAVSILLLHRVLSVREWVGICFISAGLIGLVLVGGIKGLDPWALGAAGATGIMIATYTVVDGLGVEEPPCSPTRVAVSSAGTRTSRDRTGASRAAITSQMRRHRGRVCSAV